MDSSHRPDGEAPLLLVVEDDESNRELFQCVLERAGMRVLAACGVDQARDLTTTATPDLVITDVRLPRGDGVEFVRALRMDPLLREIPVVFVTGFLFPADDLRDLQEQGLVDAILKPFNPDVLVAKVRSLLARTASKAARTRSHATSARAAGLREDAEQLARVSRKLVKDAARLLRSRTVLLIEDDDPFRYAVGKMLRVAGAAVVETATLELAVATLNDRDDIDSIVADVVLPDGMAPDGLKGFEQQRQLPVLYVSGYPEHLLRESGLSARDPQLLVKPFDADTLVARLAALGG